MDQNWAGIGPISTNTPPFRSSPCMFTRGMPRWSYAQRHILLTQWQLRDTVYPKKYAHGFVVLCFVVVMQSFIMNSHEVFIHIHQAYFTGTGAIVRLPQCQWSKPDGYGKISQCITTTKHSKAKTVCIFLGIYCTAVMSKVWFSISSGIHCEIALMRMLEYLSNAKSTLVHVMIWCREASSHYLSQWWPISLSPCGVTRPQWVDTVYLRLGLDT